MIALARYMREQEQLDALEQYARAQSEQEENGQVMDTILAWVLYANGEQEELRRLHERMEVELQQAMATSRNPSGPAALLMELYGMRGDVAQLNEVVRFFDEELKPDYMRPIETGNIIPIAYALAGDIDSAMERAEAIEQKFGTSSFWPYHFDPAFDPYRENPRYRALDDRYLAWLEEQNP
jgi:hypothetical protein